MPVACLSESGSLRTQAAQAVVKPLAEREVSSESLRAFVKPVLAREGSLFAQAACSQAEAASSRSLSLRLSAAGRARGEVINSDTSLRLDYRASSAKIMAVSSGHIDDAPGTRPGPPAGCGGAPRCRDHFQ